MSEEQIFQCPVCGLHYRDKDVAAECEAFCKANNACSIEITQKSIEHEETMN